MKPGQDVLRSLTSENINIPTTSIVQLRIDVPRLVRLSATYPEAPRETPLENHRDSAAKFFLDTVYKMAWHTVDNFGPDDSDPRLSPLLDLLEALAEVDPIS